MIRRCSPREAHREVSKPRRPSPRRVLALEEGSARTTPGTSLGCMSRRRDASAASRTGLGGEQEGDLALSRSGSSGGDGQLPRRDYLGHLTTVWRPWSRVATLVAPVSVAICRSGRGRWQSPAGLKGLRSTYKCARAPVTSSDDPAALTKTDAACSRDEAEDARVACLAGMTTMSSRRRWRATDRGAADASP